MGFKHIDQPEKVALFHRLNHILFLGVDGKYPLWLDNRIEACKKRFNPEVFEELSQKNDGKFYLYVFGQGKDGKSTLVNVLLNDEVAEMGIAPKTKVVGRYPYDEQKKGNFVIYADGKSTDFEKEPSNQEWNEILKSLEDERERFLRDITVVHYLKKKPLFQEIVVVDTPGLDQEFEETKEQSGEQAWRDWLERKFSGADACLWLINAKKPHLKPTLDKLKEISRYGKPILYVLNKIDLVDDISMTETAFLSKHPQANGHLFPVCSKKALDAMKRKNDDLKNESRITDLLEVIKREIASKAVMLKSVSAYFHVKTLKDEQDRKIKTEIELNRNRLFVIRGFRTQFSKLIDEWNSKSISLTENFINQNYSFLVESKIIKTQYDDSKSDIHFVFQLNHVKLESERIVSDCNERLKNEIKELNEKVAVAFSQNHYGYQGEVTKTIQLPVPSLSNTELHFHLKVKLDEGFWDWVLKLMPGWIRSIFVDRDKKNKELRGKMTLELSRIKGEMKKIFSKEVERMSLESIQWKELVEKSFAASFGNDNEVEKHILEYEMALREKSISNVYAHQMLNILKKLKWPRSA